MSIGTPAAIGFKDQDEPMGHVIDLRGFDGVKAPCKRCRQMIDSPRWAGERCPGEPTKETQ